MKKFTIAILALVFVVLGGCTTMPGSMVGTSAVGSSDPWGEYQQKGAWPDQRWLILDD